MRGFSCSATVSCDIALADTNNPPVSLRLPPSFTQGGLIFYEREALYPLPLKSVTVVGPLGTFDKSHLAISPSLPGEIASFEISCAVRTSE